MMGTAIVLAFGAITAYESAKLPFGTVRSPGPGFFPWWISIFIVLLALFLMGQELTSRLGKATETPGRIAKVVSLSGGLTAYVLLLAPLGYPVSTFLFVLFMLRAIDPQRWPLALGMATITAAGSYIVFAACLGVPLPRGPL